MYGDEGDDDERGPRMRFDVALILAAIVAIVLYLTTGEDSIFKPASRGRVFVPVEESSR